MIVHSPLQKKVWGWSGWGWACNFLCWRPLSTASKGHPSCMIDERGHVQSLDGQFVLWKQITYMRPLPHAVFQQWSLSCTSHAHMYQHLMELTKPRCDRHIFYSTAGSFWLGFCWNLLQESSASAFRSFWVPNSVNVNSVNVWSHLFIIWLIINPFLSKFVKFGSFVVHFCITVVYFWVIFRPFMVYFWPFFRSNLGQFWPIYG